MDNRAPHTLGPTPGRDFEWAPSPLTRWPWFPESTPCRFETHAGHIEATKEMCNRSLSPDDKDMKDCIVHTFHKRKELLEDRDIIKLLDRHGSLAPDILLSLRGVQRPVLLKT